MPIESEPNPQSPKDRRCGVCGLKLEDRLGAQCPRCLLNFATHFEFSDETGDAGDDLLDPFQVRLFGDYELIAEIARGGMGVVYRAWQISLSREVAIKMILAGELAGKTALRMFQIEAHAAANLHHPNIVPVHEIGEYETQHYFTMRFVPGGRTIADWAAEHRGEFRALAGAAAKVARAVGHAHSRGILHRDLKPSNILWDAEAGPQVTDFGLAKILDQAGESVTRHVQAMGSPSYMAPEQMDGRTAEIAATTDVYGVGAVLYEMLSGRPPFAGASALDTMRRAAEEAPAPLPGVPEDLSAICLHCLEKDPADRYSSAASLARDLERFARGEPVSVVPLSQIEILWRWAKRKPGMAALLGLCILSIFAGVAGVLWQWQKAEQARVQQAIALAHLQWQGIDRWLDEGDESRALAYLASLIREQPDRWPAVMYAMSIVEQRSFPVLAGPQIRPPVRLTCKAQIAPDGRWVAGAGEDRVVRIWGVASGKETQQLRQTSPATSLAVAAGPDRLAVATADGALALYSALDQTPIPLVRVRTEPILDLQFSADGSRLLSRSKNAVEIWIVEAPDRAPLTLALEGELKDARLAADGGRVLLWNARQAMVCESDTGREVWRAQAEKTFRHVSQAADGARVAALDGGYSVRTWDINSGQPFPTIESPLVSLNFLALDPSGQRVTVAGVSNDLTVFDVAAGLPVSAPMKHHYGVSRLETSPDGRSVISYGRDDTVNVWDAATGQARMRTIQLGGVVRRDPGLATSRDGHRVLIHTSARSDTPESLGVWQGTPVRAPQRRELKGQRDFGPSRMTPDGRFGCLSVTPGNRAYVYELASGRVLLDQPVAGEPYVYLFSPDERKCYVLTANGWLYGWSLETGRPLWEPQRQSGLVRPGAISLDGTRIIAGHSDGHIRIYDTATGALVQTLDHPGEIKSLRFAPDGSGRFVSTSVDEFAYLWDVSTGKKLQTFRGHTNTILSTAWSPDSRYLATASFDQTARLWEVATARPIGDVLQHSGMLSHLEFSPDGARLATACRDGTARLWDARTGKPLSPPLLQGWACQTVRFTRDGSAFLVLDHDGFRFWDTATAEPVTVHYPEPTVSGLGMDSENYRSIMSDDGRHVFLGNGMNAGAYWSIPQPRSHAPAWFPSFLEMLAQVRINQNGDLRPVEAGASHGFEMALREAPADDFYAGWARQILGIAKP